MFTSISWNVPKEGVCFPLTQPPDWIKGDSHDDLYQAYLEVYKQMNLGSEKAFKKWLGIIINKHEYMEKNV